MSKNIEARNGGEIQPSERSFFESLVHFNDGISQAQSIGRVNGLKDSYKSMEEAAQSECQDLGMDTHSRLLRYGMLLATAQNGVDVSSGNLDFDNARWFEGKKRLYSQRMQSYIRMIKHQA